MLTFEQIKELIGLVADHRMTGIEVERSGFRLKVDGYPAATETVQVSHGPAVEAAATATPPARPAPAPSPAATAAPEPVAVEEADPGEGAHVLTSPIVGTFYRSPNPEAPSFVEVGDRVKKGQTLCIVEAMKLMNEIEADVDGEIVAIYPENAQPVEFGERLFAIK